MKSKQFAFWKYDTFPYVLGAEVTEMYDNGTVEVKGYGRGYRFRPIKIMGLEEGTQLKQRLNKIESEYRETINTIHRLYQLELNKAAPFIK